MFGDVDNKRLPQLLILGVLCLALTACKQQCQRVWDLKTLSPDGTWTAEVHQDVCHPGIVQDEQETVELYATNNSKVGAALLTPSGQWTHPNEVKLMWLGSRILEISVPNRTIFDSLISRYGDIDIQLRYRDDNPTDRAASLDWRRQNIQRVNGEVPPLQR